MTILPPSPGEPRRPFGARDTGDAWVEAPTGEKYWGRYGAAGLLAYDADRGILMQHRVFWSHFGGTWALPGGARHEEESATEGALREAEEEAAVPDRAIRPRLASVLDLGFWSYTTIVGDVVVPFEPKIADWESTDLAWVPLDEVSERPLHPGFRDSWERLRALLPVRPTVIVDAANVVGSVPDGWWRDRAGAAERLIERLAELGERGIPAAALDLPEHTWFPRIVAVLEGQAKDAAADAPPGVEVARATGHGDDEIVAQARAAAQAGETVTVVTSDRELGERVQSVGGIVRGAGWLLDRFGGEH